MLWNRQKGMHLRANMDRQDHPQWMTNEGNISRGSVSWTMEESQGAGLNIRVCRVNVKDTPPNGEEASWVPETELDTTDCIPHSQSTAQTVREREGWEGCLGSKAQVAGGMSSSGVTLGVQECIKHIQVIYSLQRGQSWNKVGKYSPRPRKVNTFIHFF